jgi:hypothetical protein
MRVSRNGTGYSRTHLRMPLTVKGYMYPVSVQLGTLPLKGLSIH